MTHDAASFYDTWPKTMQNMKEQAPDLGKAFGAMYAPLMRDGALSVREKELIALGIGLAIRCEPCVFAHMEKAVEAGATKEQILELAGVVITMQGGPGYVHVPLLLEAYEAVMSRRDG